MAPALVLAVMGWVVLGVVVVVVCVGLFVFAFASPRRSQEPQREVDGVLDKGEETGGRAPGALGKWLRKPFETSRKATDTSVEAGRKTREKAPF